MALPMGRFDIRCGGSKSEHGYAEDKESEDYEGENDSEKKFAHEASEGILADAGPVALVENVRPSANMLS